MTSTTNLIRLQSDLKERVKWEYDFRNTRNCTRIITKEMANYSAMKPYLERNNLPKFWKAYKGCNPSPSPRYASGRHFQQPEDLGFNVISVRQLTTNQRAPNGQTNVETLPLFLVILTRNIKYQEIFKLNSLNHIIIKVESYRAQTGLTQCYNCQNFGHVWANFKQPPPCL
jgi:hypothetical protein